MFEDYAANDVLPTVQAYFIKYKRRDIVFGIYLTSSLKFETRSKRGRGVRRRVTSKGKLPTNWRNFLRDNDNETELLNYLADTIGQMSTSNMVIVTKEEEALATTASAYMQDMQQRKAVK